MKVRPEVYFLLLLAGFALAAYADALGWADHSFLKAASGGVSGYLFGFTSALVVRERR